MVPTADEMVVEAAKIRLEILLGTPIQRRPVQVVYCTQELAPPIRTG
jgi:hypothetical protein